jgi:TM2 domain-containing membrane protein YozV
MLDPGADHRARAVYRAAVTRFDAGSFAACGRILDDRVLLAVADSGAVDPGARPPAAHVEALGGLADMGLGNWDGARVRFGRGVSLAPDTITRRRIGSLAAFVTEDPRLPSRSPGIAGTMSAILPGSGHFYCGRGSDGFRHLLFNTLMILTTVSFARGGHVPAAVLTGTLAVPFYLGNIRGAASAARRFDRDQRHDLLGRAIDASAR